MNDTLFAEAVLGKDAEEFIASDLGRYLIGQADMEIEEAQEALCKVAPLENATNQGATESNLAGTVL